MPRAAKAFLDENFELGDNMQDHLEPQGDYSIEIMSMVLRTKAMEAFGQLRWHMDIQRAMTAEDLRGCIGAVVNLEGRHWETELLRQAERQEAKNQQSYAEALGGVADTSLGGRLTAEQREKLEEPQVKDLPSVSEILSDPLVRRAMRLLTSHDRDGFLAELRSNERLVSHMRYLCDAEVFGRAEVCSFDL
eukprot:s2765_g7.t1